MHVIIGVTGATGAIYAVKLLEALRKEDSVVVHLILSDWGRKNIQVETSYEVSYVESLADFVYDNHNLAASISSGSYPVDSMVILPCSMKTLSSVANGFDDNLISRAAGVTLKEGRQLVLSPRESPLSAIHLENMLKLARLGVRIVPPVTAFYSKPETIDDIVSHHIMKIMDQLKVNFSDSRRWGGTEV